jgi:hypothetical protein
MDPLTAALFSGAAGSAAGALNVENVFFTSLYTGNGSTQTISNGIDLSGKGGMVWLKSRSAATGNRLVDTVRGATKSLESNSNAVEAIESTGLTSFTSTGFTLGADADYNTSTATYGSWTFREQEKFFDVVTWTGDGVTTTTVAHSLGVTPAVVIVKRLDSAGEWGVNYLRGDIGSGGIIGYSLNLTAALRDTGNAVSTYFTSTTLRPSFLANANSSALQYNATGGTFVAYLFAHDAGGFGSSGTDSIISCGKYAGNGSTTGTTVTLGWQPQWLLIKRSDTTGNWNLIDSQRGFVSGGTDAELNPNLSNAESSGTFVSPLSTGFQLNTTDAEYNANGGTYIYVAIRASAP